MFMTRRRLRFDGLYYITTVKVMMGCQEGRGMKEAGKDFYRGPLAVTYHRIFRFFPNGMMFCYITSMIKTIAEARKGAVEVDHRQDQLCAHAPHARACACTHAHTHTCVHV